MPNGHCKIFQETRFEANLFIPFAKYPHLLNSEALAVNRYLTVRDSMEDDLRTGTPYRISCLRQQPSGVDRRCHICDNNHNQRVYQILVYRNGFL